jgi:hypothetical protein
MFGVIILADLVTDLLCFLLAVTCSIFLDGWRLVGSATRPLLRKLRVRQ